MLVQKVRLSTYLKTEMLCNRHSELRIHSKGRSCLPITASNDAEFNLSLFVSFVNKSVISLQKPDLKPLPNNVMKREAKPVMNGPTGI